MAKRPKRSGQVKMTLWMPISISQAIERDMARNDRDKTKTVLHAIKKYLGTESEQDAEQAKQSV